MYNEKWIGNLRKFKFTEVLKERWSEIVSSLFFSCLFCWFNVILLLITTILKFVTRLQIEISQNTSHTIFRDKSKTFANTSFVCSFQPCWCFTCPPNREKKLPLAFRLSFLWRSSWWPSAKLYHLQRKHR